MSQKKNAKHPPLQILQQKLEASDFSSNYLPANSEEELYFDTLLISLDEAEDDQQDENEVAKYILQAFFVEDMMKAENPDLPSDEIPNFAMLQMMTELPFSWEKVAEERLADGLQLLNICSQKMPFGHFSLDQDTLVYNYAFLSETQRVNSDILLSVLDMIGFFINRMAPVLEGFQADNLSLEAAVDALDQQVLETE